MQRIPKNIEKNFYKKMNFAWRQNLLPGPEYVSAMKFLIR